MEAKLETLIDKDVAMDEWIREIIKREIDRLRESLIKSLDELSLGDLLKRKNPYLLACIANEPIGIILYSLQAFIISSLETKMGKVLEDIAHAMCGEKSKSAATGIDLELIKGDCRLLISIKSGASWGNSQSTAEQGKNFEKAKKVIRQNDRGKKLVTVMGICYGKSRTSESLKYADVKVEGQNFWYLITGDKDFFKKICGEMAFGAEEFEARLNAKKKEVCNRLLDEFNAQYADGICLLVEDCCGNFSPKDEWMNEIMNNQEEQ